MKTLNLCSIFVLVIILSCSESDPKPKTPVELFSGTWNWTYTVNCGVIESFTGDVIITESTINEGELYVVLPGLGGFEANASGEPNPFFYFSFDDANGINTNANGYLNDGELEIEGSQSDDSPLFYCFFTGIAEK